MIADKKNINDWKKFFKEYGHLRNFDLAILADVSIECIRNWKVRCGLAVKSAKNPFNSTYRPPKVQVEVVPPEVWMNKEWFYQKYVVEGIGTNVLARMINRAKETTFGHIRRYGFKPKPLNERCKSKNPCCTYQWLYEHYEIYNFSIRKCAKLANVCESTIVNWLACHKIYIKSLSEAYSGEHGSGFGRQSNLHDYRKPVNK